LVISKGQGNYESLNDVKNKEIFFSLENKVSNHSRGHRRKKSLHSSEGIPQE
jgi:uncharacterized protein with ATP-grasp and redox domains